jgi:hypothetical protein
VSGNHVYLAGWDSGFQIIDVSDPSNCVHLGSYTAISRATDVEVSGNHEFVTAYHEGLQVFNLNNPIQPIRVGGYNTYGYPLTVAVRGNYAYVADGSAGLQIIDVSNPTNCVLVGNRTIHGFAWGLAIDSKRICIATGADGLLVLPNLIDVQLSLRIEATPNLPFTLEAATNLSDPNSWQSLLTTNVATMPFDFVDFDVKTAEKPQKFYRVRQP